MTDSDDKDLFQAAMADVTPLNARDETQWLKSPFVKTARQPHDEAQLDNPLESGEVTIVPLDTPLEYKADGIQQGVLDKLRSGKYPHDASLNLIRQPVESCRRALYTFLCQAQQDNQRNLLIIHGKGRGDRTHANIVRSYLAGWLKQFDSVQAFCSAQPHHGGSGACYVALRKSDRARIENRERHAKRSR